MQLDSAQSLCGKSPQSCNFNLIIFPVSRAPCMVPHALLPTSNALTPKALWSSIQYKIRTQKLPFQLASRQLKIQHLENE